MTSSYIHRINLTSRALIASLLALLPGLSLAENVRSIDHSATIQILGQTDYLFPKEQACGENNRISVGEFLTDSLILLSEDPAGDTRVTVRCDALKVADDLRSFYGSEIYPDVAVRQLAQLKDGTPIHQCTVTLSNKQEEYAWARGIQALIDETGERLIEGTLRCLLTP